MARFVRWNPVSRLGCFVVNNTPRNDEYFRNNDSLSAECFPNNTPRNDEYFRNNVVMLSAMGMSPTQGIGMSVSSGHSLLELIIVIVIISIMAFAGVANFRGSSSHVNETVMAAQLEDLVRFAQLESQTRREAIGLCQSENHRCITGWRDELMVFADQSGDGMIHDRHQIMRTISFPHNKGVLHWRSYPSYRHYLQFSSEQLTANDNGTLWFCQQHAASPSFAFTMARSGLLTLIRPDRQGRVKDGDGRALVC